MTKRAVLYARVSGDDRRTATSSIDAQLVDCRKYAADKGYRVIAEYFEEPDKHTSGADWLPELDKVVKLAHQGGYDVLIVWKMDRLARNRFKQLSIENSLEKAGVTVEYAGEQYEDTKEGRLLKGLISEFAEFERETIKARVQAGKVRSVEAGNVNVGGCCAPFGYDLVTVNRRRCLVINAQEAAVVGLIFDLYANQNYTLHKLVDYLDSHNIAKPGKGNSHKAATCKDKTLGWSVGALAGILKNETYIGRWHYGKTKRVKNPTGKTQNLIQPKDEWLLIEVPGIINEAIWQGAQNRMLRNKHERSGGNRYFYTLGGMMTCGHCGHSMIGLTVSRGKRWSYYICNARTQPKRYGFKCEAAYYKAQEVNAAVWSWVTSILLQPDKLTEALADYQTQQASVWHPFVNMIDANEKKLLTLEGEKGRLIKAYTAGILSLDEIAQQKGELDKRINDTIQANRELKAEVEPRRLSDHNIETIGAYAAQIREGVDMATDDPETQRKIYKLIDMRVTLTDTNGGKWVDIACVLGKERLPTDYGITNYNLETTNAPSPPLILPTAKNN